MIPIKHAHPAPMKRGWFVFPRLILAGSLVLGGLSACQPRAATEPFFTAPQSDSPVQAEQQAPSSPELETAPPSLPTPSPVALTPTPVPTQPHPTPTAAQALPLYIAQSGDSLAVVAARFAISTTEIASPDPLPSEGLLTPGQELRLPERLAPLPTPPRLLPDSEVVFSPSALDFDVQDFLDNNGGFLKDHREYLKSTGWTSAAAIIERIARENSINPRLLLSLLEYSCGCVRGFPEESVQVDYLLEMTDFRRQGLYRQLGWASSQLAVGYYGWRGATLRQFPITDGIMVRPAPTLNAGSVALQYFFATYGDYATWRQATDAETGLAALHTDMFGDPWERASTVEPLFPPGLTQPGLILPFEEGRLWSFTSGPHTVWENEGAQAALDFAPATHESGCIPTDAWAVAVADGRVARAEFGAVVLDLDEAGGMPSDSREQTGWAILYMHMASEEQVGPGTPLRASERIGHPSCEGGRTTGTHLHIARKYNGEWVIADGPLPFTLDGWVAHAGQKPYEGTLTLDGQTVVAHPYGNYETKIMRPTPTPDSAGQ
ncbi:MAG: hypothetical protein PHS96_12755 [Anaerolineales bacterium]|nr:hypothetical protein [Anaerolineales bacterium]